jgi:hypothetical protein
MDRARLAHYGFGSTIYLDRYCKCYRLLHGYILGIIEWLGGSRWDAGPSIERHYHWARAVQLRHGLLLVHLHRLNSDYYSGLFSSPDVRGIRGSYQHEYPITLLIRCERRRCGWDSSRRGTLCASFDWFVQPDMVDERVCNGS